ncbi:hypothetical protein A464_222 [Salmonella bongori N268-08]|uniref:Uncharacterized protein n=1 Tax=Salmonella bongori N268-08 TaxID=1197719 RepID=S5MS36_SALBN|nr:hypothetical protein A464_222 [Salmonella bongori N268-08]
MLVSLAGEWCTKRRAEDIIRSPVRRFAFYPVSTLLDVS